MRSSWNGQGDHRAHEKAVNSNAVEEAKTYFDECMKVLDTVPTTPRNRERRMCLLVKSFVMFQLLLQTPQYYELLSRYDSIVVELDNTRLVGEFYASKAWCQVMYGSYHQATKNEKKGLRLCELAVDAEGVGRSYAALQWGRGTQGYLEEAVELKNEIVGKLDERASARRTVSPVAIAAIGNARWSVGGTMQ